MSNELFPTLGSRNCLNSHSRYASFSLEKMKEKGALGLPCGKPVPPPRGRAGYVGGGRANRCDV